jgi:hypothetical protein
MNAWAAFCAMTLAAASALFLLAHAVPTVMALL